MNAAERREIIQQIKDLKAERGWNNARLAEECVPPLSENTVADALGGRKNTQEGKLRAMLTALDVPVEAQDRLVLEGLTDDVRIFLGVTARRLAVLTEYQRTAALAALYPALLTATEQQATRHPVLREPVTMALGPSAEAHPDRQPQGQPGDAPETGPAETRPRSRGQRR